MLDLIEKIIEIDKSARQRVRDADEKARGILDEANAEKARIESDYTDRIKKRLEIVAESYNKIANEDIEEITRKKAERFNRLDSVMEQNSERWVNEIMGRVTGAGNET
ncbi:MAG: hypothetical protein LBI36_04180 [Oscillospiraceae bacterium]|jgi:vacuolar-type H+-ATPase subunit H|nr:hypothetical protein [Oscillospiraceae bacterium]